MGRSSKKGPYIDVKLQAKIETLERELQAIRSAGDARVAELQPAGAEAGLVEDLRALVLLQDQLEAGERKFLIDFASTGYIDSSGLGALVSISKRIRESGGELRLSGLNEDLRSLFELTKLDTLFAIANTPQQALASF